MIMASWTDLMLSTFKLVVICFHCSIVKSVVNVYFYKALMELLDKVQFSYDTSDQDVSDITDGEWQHKT